MRTSAGCWLAVGLLFGCTPSPTEVIGPYSGSAGSSGSATGGSSGEQGTGTTGPIAEGSADSGTGMPTSMTGDTGTTAPVDPVTTDPDTTSADDVPVTDSSSGDPGSSSSGDPPPPPTCQELFGTASNYNLCMEDDTSCMFALDTGGMSCNGICGSFGHACLGAIDNPGGYDCSNRGNLTCNDAGKSTTICICAK